MTPIVISSADDPRVADYENIRESELVGRRGVFIAEGGEVVRTAIRRGRFPLRSVFVMDKRVDAMADVLAEVDAPIYVASAAVMNEIVGFDIHRGCLAAGDIPAREDPLGLVSDTGPVTVLVLEALANHDNVGAAFRNAAAFGVDAIFLDPRSADPLYRKAIRTSMGATLFVPFARLENWPSALQTLAEKGLELVALTPSGDIAFSKLEPAERLALLLGTEGVGLSEGAIAFADHRARIEMAPGHDSLNVATAAAIGLYIACASRVR